MTADERHVALLEYCLSAARSRVADCLRLGDGDRAHLNAELAANLESELERARARVAAAKRDAEEFAFRHGL